MKNTLILINILTLLTTSCGSLSPQAERSLASGEPVCKDLVKEIMTTEQLTPKKLNTFLKLELSEAELSDFFSEFKNYKLNTENEKTFRSIFLYSKEDSEVRKILLKEFHDQLDNNQKNENKVWDKFIAHKNKVEKQRLKFLAKEETEAGKIEALEKSMIYEKLYYSCKTQIKGKPTPNDLAQSKRLTYSLMAGGMGSTIVTYTGVHWDEDKNSKWFNELYFTLGMGAVFSYLGGKTILSKPNLDPWKAKMPLAFLNNAIADAGTTAVYAYLFNSNDKEMEKKLEDLKKDPDAQQKLQALLQIAKDENLFEKHLKNTQDLFKDKQTGVSMNTADFDHEISFEDIDLDASRELLLAALAEQEYKQKSGMLATGSSPLDRYTYNRLFNLISVPTNIGLTILMKNQMCMATDPKKGFMKAVGLYMSVSILFDSLYFVGKKHVINQ